MSPTEKRILLVTDIYHRSCHIHVSIALLVTMSVNSVNIDKYTGKLTQLSPDVDKQNIVPFTECVHEKVNGTIYMRWQLI